MPKTSRRTALVSVAVLATLGLTACGSRESHATLEAALRPVSSTAPRAATVPSSGTAAGEQQSSTGGSGTTGTTSGGSGSTTGGSTGTASGSTTTTSTGTTSANSGGTTGKTSTSKGSTGSSTGAAATADTSSGIPGVDHCTSELSPVNIASVGEQSGLAGAAVAAGASAVAAWAGYVNSLGGLRCHPIHFTAADDGADPSRNAALTQQLVQQNHVVAFVFNNAPLAAAGSEKFLIQNHIPVIGSEGADDFYNTYPNFFPQMPSGKWAIYASYAGLPSVMTASQKKHFGLIYCIEASACSIFGSSEGKADIAHDGMDLVYSANASLTAPDFTSQCLGAKRAGVTMLFLILDPNSMHRAAANCRAAGYTGPIATAASVVTPDYLGDSNLSGVVFDSIVEPWTQTSNPQIKLMNDVLARYAPGLSPVGSTAQGWTAAQLFAYSSTFWPNTDTITSADVLAAMDRVKHYDVGGLTGPLTFVKGKPAPPVVCWYPMGMKNDKFYAFDNGRRTCK